MVVGSRVMIVIVILAPVLVLRLTYSVSLLAQHLSVNYWEHQ